VDAYRVLKPGGGRVKTVRELISLSGAYLAEKGVDSPRLNAERLLGDVLGLARIELYLQSDRPITEAELSRYRALIRRRAAGEPLQTIIGVTGFYSREFKTAPGVFIPRPETERLVEVSVGLLTPSDHRLLTPRVADVGCGSGVIAVSLAAEIPAAEVWASDICPLAVDLTRQNAHRLGVETRVHALVGDMMQSLSTNLQGRVDLLVSNPPYIRSAELAGLPREVSHDPSSALDGGVDGLDYYHALAAAGCRWLIPGGWLAVEIGAEQGGSVPHIFQAAGYSSVSLTHDYNDLPRVVVGQKPEERF
jgi:release factor glutamine methyltransferase